MEKENWISYLNVNMTQNIFQKVIVKMLYKARLEWTYDYYVSKFIAWRI